MINNPHSWNFDFGDKFTSTDLYSLEDWYNRNLRFLEYTLNLRLETVYFQGLDHERLNDIIINIYGICFSAYYKLKYSSG